MKILIMCIGNKDGGDDGVGPFLAKKLKNAGLDTVDCETTPENYTSVVKNKSPDRLLIIDAIDMKLDPGEIRIVPMEKIGVMHVSTHGIPLSVLIGYFENYIKNIILIGIQPKKMSGNLSKVVIESAEKLLNFIKHGKIKEIKILTNNKKI